ncbi:flavin reductase family protein [Streptomyces sp. NPDC057638]|uniref:flavin reductase family protein n=1 Tax=Streptomyces sp. NPDC057638 TaxID=3346190 RepID=UPI003681441A
MSFMMGHAAMATTVVRHFRDRPPCTPARFRQVLGHFATGVTVITTRDADGPAGFACQSFSALSLTPPLVVFLVGRASTTWPRIERTGVFCVSVLGAGQEELCRSFAVSGGDKFTGVPHRPAPATGAPVLAGAVAWIDCRVQEVHEGGDHLIVVGRVEALAAAPDLPDPPDPLLFHRGRFRRLGP